MMMEDSEIVEAVAMEEDLLLLKNGKSAYDRLRESKASVEEIVSQILSVKKDGNSKSQLRGLVTQTFLHFVTLRQYPDIDLVPEEEFFRDAPEDIKSSVLSSDGSHNLMLKRLNYELHQRKELCKLREKLELQKKSLAEMIANRKKFLSSAPANVETLRIDNDVPDDEDNAQRRRKRPKRAPSKENPDQAGIHQVHPLKLILHVLDDEPSDPKSAKLISLKFEYLLKLNVVCVGLEGSHEGAENSILCNLFPDDTGSELPHQSAKLTTGSSLSFDEKKPSRPYKWAQHLAGIDFLPEIAPLLGSHETSSDETSKTDVVSGLSLYRQQNRVQTIVQRIRSRKRAQLALAQQLDSLMKLKWPSLSCESVPWALHTSLCSLDGWSSIGPPPNHLSLHTEHVEESMNIDTDGQTGTSKEGSEDLREDGELPSLLQAGSIMANNVKQLTSTPKVSSSAERSRQLSLISKTVVSPFSKGKSHSFNKYAEDIDPTFLDFDSDHDELPSNEHDTEGLVPVQRLDLSLDSWVYFGAKEYSLILVRAVGEGRNVKLKAKIEISMEYPLRPPLFSVDLLNSEGSQDGGDNGSRWYNELRGIEAEVNLNILKLVPSDEENNILAHQVHRLAMLFDYLMDDEASSPSQKNTHVVDFSLSKPASGTILARSHRGRDRRKMISWKDMDSKSGNL
ncbi:unnamed protein product [Linum tenue]|uniref:THO complex subunit 5 n=1 Tax=Linum tenue TaxID=586396 RepID=A0AAV0P2N0_9ROSI|nr:unnamed protein product [Linum tenue]